MIKKNGQKIAAIALASVLIGQNLQPVFATELLNEKTEKSSVIENVEENANVEQNKNKGTTTNKITLFHTNDTHGRLRPDDKVIGVDRVATMKKNTENSLLVDAGDTLHGLPFVTLSKGKDALDLLNASGYDFIAPGNHDFNYGYKRLVELFQDVSFKPGVNKLRPLSANTMKDGKSLFETNYVKEMIVNGKTVKVGFFGLSTPETAYKTNPLNVLGIDFTSPIDAAKAEVEKLEAKNVDVIVGIGHIGLDESTDITSRDMLEVVDGIDVFVDGHSHTEMPDGEMVNNTLLVSTGEYLNNLGKVEIELDENNNVVNKSAKLLNRAYMSNVEGDATISKMMKDIENAQKPILETVIGKTETDLDGDRNTVRFGESNLGNLITDAMIDDTEADIAITNGGGIRASIKAGNITKGDMESVFPFGNYVVTKKLTGAQIKEILEFGVENYGVSFGGFPHVGGMKYVIDPEQPIGERIVSMTINGEKLDLNKTYTVATNDFLAIGGDDYPVFGELPTLNEFGSLAEILERFVVKLGTVNYSIEGRITTGKKADFEEVVNPDKDVTNPDKETSDIEKPETDTSENEKPDTDKTEPKPIIKPDTKPDINKEEGKNPQTGDVSMMPYLALGSTAIVALAVGNRFKKTK